MTLALQRVCGVEGVGGGGGGYVCESLHRM